MTLIGLNTGASYDVELPGRGSAGYVWEFAVEGAPETVAVKRQEGALPPGVVLPSSFSRTARFEVRGLRPGRARVRFQLRRPWEPDPLPGEELILEIEVRA